MSTLLRFVPFAVLASVGLQMVGCGSMNGSADRRLQTIRLSPPTATGHGSSNDEVQFTATGIFTLPPSPITPLSIASWMVSDPTLASVNNAGVAGCRAGAMGTVTVKAIASQWFRYVRCDRDLGDWDSAADLPLDLALGDRRCWPTSQPQSLLKVAWTFCCLSN